MVRLCSLYFPMVESPSEYGGFVPRCLMQIPDFAPFVLPKQQKARLNKTTRPGLSWRVTSRTGGLELEV